MKRSSSETGKLGEELTAFYLEKSGYTILHRNFRIRGGEIDIIARKDDVIAFVEVKTRGEGSYESGAEAVTKRKRRLIIKTSLEYMIRYPEELQPRYDVAEVTVREGRVKRLRYLDSAFGGEDYFDN
ncbi:MAG: YraN family protein [Oscillospiraceae bacterium]|nr:YraN family protein [Oscillospiraceae bacterium]